MTKLITRTLLLISALFSFSSMAADDAISTGIFNDLAIDGYDSVAYFTVNKPVEGSKKFELTWRDATWRFSSQENMLTRIFGRLTAWQNWIFQRPNAVGEKGALKVYGKGEKVQFDMNRV